jgi:cytochrome c553
MTRKNTTTTVMVVAAAVFSGTLLRAMETGQSAIAPDKQKARVERGAHLVASMGCDDCHTPTKMGPNGPEKDMARRLTGHPQDMAMPPAPGPTGPWLWHGAATSTAFAGPWGTSFTANLTPDKETGLGNWTEEMFIATARTGRHQGKGRPVLPPMPINILNALDDEDLRSIFAYLQSLAPMKNRVPAPVEPADGSK